MPGSPSRLGPRAFELLHQRVVEFEQAVKLAPGLRPFRGEPVDVRNQGLVIRHVLRLRQEAVFTVLEEFPLTPADRDENYEPDHPGV